MELLRGLVGEDCTHVLYCLIHQLFLWSLLMHAQISV